MKKKSKAARSGNDSGGNSRARTAPPPKRAPFPIVGIGASAGGLEALEQFLSRVPPGSGMAFVIVQHLDPTHKGIMPELLQRATTMKVLQVKDRTRVQPGCVYVIPPNKDMSILHGVLHLLPPAAPRGLRLPIDFFLRSLAQDLQDRSIGVILSGMGSDGTLGLRAIKEKAGLALVQDPATAKFDGMPRSAVDAGLADIVAPVEDLPAKILAFLQHVPLLNKPEEPFLGDKTQSVMEKAIILLRAQTGHDFSLYKPSTIRRRIQRRMAVQAIETIDNYVKFLQRAPAEGVALFRDLLIGVTHFFRDAEAFKFLEEQGVPMLFEGKPPGSTIRVWSAGCSTGEEAYSLAILLREHMEALGLSHNVQIFATDIDSRAIATARAARYPTSIAADITPERLKHFFTIEPGGEAYRVHKSIRDMLIFSEHDLIKDPPFSKIDFVICRNLLIYLNADLQKRLIQLFHYTMTPPRHAVSGHFRNRRRFHRFVCPAGPPCEALSAHGELAGCPAAGSGSTYRAAAFADYGAPALGGNGGSCRKTFAA